MDTGKKVYLYDFTKSDIKIIIEWLEKNIGLEFTEKDAIEFTIHYFYTQVVTHHHNVLWTVKLPAIEKEVYKKGLISYYIRSIIYDKLKQTKYELKTSIPLHLLLSSIIRYCVWALPQN